MRFAFLSFRPFVADFRRYLMEALQSLGHSCVHVYLRRRAIEVRSGAGLDIVTPLGSLADLADYLRRFFGASQGIVVNSAGNSAPDIVLGLWVKLRDCVWIYDVYDWMLYDATGMTWLQWWATDRLYRSTASRCCLLSKDLQSRYPNSFHLNNASHLVPVHRRHAFDNRVVTTASFDRRTDFELLRRFAEAAPEITLDLYGSIYDDDPATTDALSRLTAERKNIAYHGRFEMDKLQDILSNYTVGLVPYRTPDVMTRYINPDKLFHYLCAGIEVVTTPIPAAKHLSAYVYQAEDAATVLAAIRRVVAFGERRNPCNLHERFNWRIRAQEFCFYLGAFIDREELPRQAKASLT